MSERILGLVMTGGLSRRMGTPEGAVDKAFVPLAGKPMLAHVIARAAPQVDRLILNSNRQASLYRGFGFPVIKDEIGGFAGPLAGIHAGMAYARQNGYRRLVSWACDAPFTPQRFVRDVTAVQQKTGSSIVTATSNGRTHPVSALWPVDLLDSLTAFLDDGGRKVDLWTANHKTATCDFGETGDFSGTRGGIDPFFNINTPADLAAAERFLKT